MVFRMATTPVSWTKDTAVNTGTLRVINGSVSPGGSLIWNDIFATRSYNGGIQSADDGCAVQQASTTITLAQAAGVQATSSPTALSTAQITAHTHQVIQGAPGTTNLRTSGPTGTSQGVSTVQTAQGPTSSPTTGQGSGHTHVVNAQHNHTGPGPVSHNHTISGQHSHTFSPGSVDFNLTYVDMIIASKDA
jgi:hypothetical protein